MQNSTKLGRTGNYIYGSIFKIGLLQRIFGRREAVKDEQWQVPIVQEICIAMIRQIPEHWNSAVLVLEPTEKGIGTGLSHSAVTPQASKDFALRDGEFVTPDMAVMAATRQLELGWVERKGTFKRAIISAIRDGEDWDIKSEYEH